MTDTQARLDAIRRWRDWRGSGFPAGDEDGLVVVTELVSAIVLGDALAAELERATAAREQFAWIAREAGGDCDPGRIIRACENAIDALALAYENNPDCGAKPDEIAMRRAKVLQLRKEALDGSD